MRRDPGPGHCSRRGASETSTGAGAQQKDGDGRRTASLASMTSATAASGTLGRVAPSEATCDDEENVGRATASALNGPSRLGCATRGLLSGLGGCSLRAAVAAPTHEPRRPLLCHPEPNNSFSRGNSASAPPLGDLGDATPGTSWPSAMRPGDDPRSRRGLGADCSHGAAARCPVSPGDNANRRRGLSGGCSHGADAAYTA
mmetsp:Transcript_66834/g.186596  ORF Transcript_66834/g.186596 Transcript_66834/m.186596 type:complete len:201 (+) Transcript_66834:849-1451(+)